MNLKKWTNPILILFNAILLAMGWIMSFYTYPRLPDEIPLWLAFAGQEALTSPKSVLFFLYPAAQTLFIVLFASICLIYLNRDSRFTGLPERRRQVVLSLKREFVFLVLIFFNLIFIHISRSVILTAQGIEEGVSGFYFYSLFIIILVLIPFFKLREKLLAPDQPQ